MFAFLEKDTFPWWYTPVKWGIPLGLAAFAGVGTGLLLTGSVGMPAFFGMLKWAPAFFSSLEGFSAIAVLGMATSAMASTVGVVSSFLLRATLLFPLTETIATNAQRTHHDLQTSNQLAIESLQKRLQEANEVVESTDKELKQVTTKYYELRGAHETLTNRPKTKAPIAPGTAAPTAAPAANDAKEESAGKRAKPV